MEIHKTIIGLAIATVIVMGTLVPFISSAVVSYDQDGSVLSFGSYGSDELDGWSMSASVTGSAVHVTSTMWKGSVDGSTYLLASDSGNIWYDGSIHSLMGNVYRTYTSLEASIENGALKIGSDSYSISTVYVPSSKGTFGSHNNGSVNDPIMGVGSFAGITLGANDTSVTGNTSDYVLEKAVSTTDGRETIEFVAGEYETPVQVPPTQQVQMKPGLDLDVFDDPEIFEKEDLGTIEKGEITIVPGKGDMVGDIDIGGTVVVPGKIDMGDVITDPEKVPTADVQATENATSGTTGDCTWELVGTTLYIRGPGKTDNMSTTRAPPWGRDITYAVVEEGVTYLGYAFFYHYPNLTGVELANSITEFGRFMFVGDKLLESVTLPSSLKTLSESAFNGCTGLKEINWGPNIKTININALANCPSLKELTIPSTVTSIATQDGMHFYDADGVELTTPVPGYYRAGEPSNLYIAQEAVVGDYSGWIYAVGMDLTDVGDSETVYLPYTVEYDGKEYPVRSLESGAISGSAIKYVVIPQSVGYISSTAVSAPNVQQVLNLSGVDVSAQGDVRTSVPATVTLSEMSIVYSPYRDVIQAVPLVLILGFVIAAVGSIGSRRL